MMMAGYISSHSLLKTAVISKLQGLNQIAPEKSRKRD